MVERTCQTQVLFGILLLLQKVQWQAGIRRIEAITGEAAKNYFIDRSNEYAEIKKILNVQDPVKAVHSLKEENAELQKASTRVIKRQS